MSARPPTSPPITPERLEQAALRYLGRFASSAANLRRVLMGRVERSARDHGTDRTQATAWIDALIERYQRSGWLDDAGYAALKAAGLRRQGASAQAIRGRLAVAGVAPDLVIEAIADVDLELGREPDLVAARALCRRRRLGPFRRQEERAQFRAKDLASLGRAGFDYATARRAIDDGNDELEPD